MILDDDDTARTREFNKGFYFGYDTGVQETANDRFYIHFLAIIGLGTIAFYSVRLIYLFLIK